MASRLILQVVTSSEHKNSILVDGNVLRSLGVLPNTLVDIERVEPSNIAEVSFSLDREYDIDGLESYLHQYFIGRAILEGQIVSLTATTGKISVRVARIRPGQYGVVHKGTTVKIAKGAFVASSDSGFARVGGLGTQIERLKEITSMGRKDRKLMQSLGVTPPKGVLLHGPPGTGKTLLARALAEETDHSFFLISGPELISRYVGESERGLREVFMEAKENTPAIIFIDEIDAIAPKREDAHGEVERRMVSQLLTLLDGLDERGEVIVLAASNLPDHIDPALRRPGRLDLEIEAPIPNAAERLAILEVHAWGMPLDPSIDLAEIAKALEGFVGADIQLLVKEAALSAYRVLRHQKSPDAQIKQDDFRKAMTVVSPSALRSFRTEYPPARWQDIVGMKSVTTHAKDFVRWHAADRDKLRDFDLVPPQGVLISGGSGNGKTLLARAVATSIGKPTIWVTSSEVFKRLVGESERSIRRIFDKARSTAPCTIVIDDIDVLSPKHGEIDALKDRIMLQLVSELDRLPEDVVVIATTTRPIEELSASMTQMGRLEYDIKIDPPSDEEIDRLLKHGLRGTKIGVSKSSTGDSASKNLEAVRASLFGKSRSQIMAACQRAKLKSLKRKRSDGQLVVSPTDFVIETIGFSSGPSESPKDDFRPTGWEVF